MKSIRYLFILFFAMLFASAAHGQERRTNQRPQPVRQQPQPVRKVEEPRKQVRQQPQRQKQGRTHNARRSVNCNEKRIEPGAVKPVQRSRTPRR
jgi:hypothetical protein